MRPGKRAWIDNAQTGTSCPYPGPGGGTTCICQTVGGNKEWFCD